MRKRFLLRIDQELWNDIDRWSKEELRSVNGQMEYILRQAVERRKRSNDQDEGKPPRGRS